MSSSSTSSTISTVLEKYSFISETEACSFILTLFPGLIRIENDIKSSSINLHNETINTTILEEETNTNDNNNDIIFQCPSEIQSSNLDSSKIRCQFHIKLTNKTNSMIRISSIHTLHCPHCTHSSELSDTTRHTIDTTTTDNHPRIPYVSIDVKEPIELVESIRKRRRGNLINLDRMLLHSPPFAHGWNIFLQNVRENLSVNAKLKEICICVVAVLNKAKYEFLHHAPELIKAGGTTIEIQALKYVGQLNFSWNIFNILECHIIILTVCMTRSIHVPECVLSCLRELLGNQVVVELVGVIATYNMVSRFLVALGVTPEDHH